MPTLVYLIIEEKTKDKKFPHYIDSERYKVPIDNLCVTKPLLPLGSVSGVGRGMPNLKNSLNNDELAIEDYINGASNGVGAVEIINLKRTRTLTSNELWHLQKNGMITYRWKAMANGASHWKNNIVSSHRIKYQNIAKSKAIGGRKGISMLRKAGPALLVADITLSGELKTSHIVNAFLIGASSTGIGAIVAGAYFLTDIGFEFVTGTSLSDRIDKKVGTIELYEGLY